MQSLDISKARLALQKLILYSNSSQIYHWFQHSLSRSIKQRSNNRYLPAWKDKNWEIYFLLGPFLGRLFWVLFCWEYKTEGVLVVCLWRRKVVLMWVCLRWFRILQLYYQSADLICGSCSWFCVFCCYWGCYLEHWLWPVRIPFRIIFYTKINGKYLYKKNWE
jgi:hypothetical protein